MTESELQQLDNVRARLEIAVESLATSGAHIRLRLVNAFRSIFVFRPQDFPAGRLRTTFDEIVESMTRHPGLGDTSSAEVTAHHLRRPEAELIAKRIFGLYSAVTHELLMANTLRAMPS